MALTSTVKTDLYRFFAVAFDAAPGVTYMSQLADAVNSGMTTQQIVEVFTSKAQFTSVYPSFFTNEQFAAKLVENVVGTSATDASKAEAAASIVSALALGGEWTRGKVIYTLFNNIANKAVTDTQWGTTAQQLANQVAYAEYYTETLLTDSTDMTALRAVIANVTAATSTATADIAAALTPAVAAQTYTLTTGVDTFSGTSGNDTFNAGDVASAAVWTTGDALNGGIGTDVLNVTSAAAVTTPTAASVTAIETANLTSGAAVNVNASAWTGLTALNTVVLVQRHKASQLQPLQPFRPRLRHWLQQKLSMVAQLSA